MVYNRREVGHRLRQKRERMNITAEELAKRIGKKGGYYRDIERGQCGMSIETLILLSSAMDVSLDYLVYGVVRKEEGTEEQEMVSRLLGRCDALGRRGAVDILKAYIEALSPIKNRRHSRRSEEPQGLTGQPAGQPAGEPAGQPTGRLGGELVGEQEAGNFQMGGRGK